jgi:hypothetical protein
VRRHFAETESPLPTSSRRPTNTDKSVAPGPSGKADDDAIDAEFEVKE